MHGASHSWHLKEEDAFDINACSHFSELNLSNDRTLSMDAAERLDRVQ